MFIVHQSPLEGEAVFACARAGCRACQDGLMHQHERLVHFILRQQASGDATYDDLLQEGRIGLWQAILHFDPQRGVAFSTYAGVAIQHRIWHAAKQAGLPESEPSPADLPDACELAEENVWRADVREALVGAVSRLPERLRQVVCAAYGLDGAPTWRRPVTCPPPSGVC